MCVCLLAQSAILPAVVWAVCDTTAQLVAGTRTAALTGNRAGAGESGELMMSVSHLVAG